VILLVVITLLTLFAVVGITFVIFAQSEAVASRVWRESETLQRPDMDPPLEHRRRRSYCCPELLYGFSGPMHPLLSRLALAALGYLRAESRELAPVPIELAQDAVEHHHPGGIDERQAADVQPNGPADQARAHHGLLLRLGVVEVVVSTRSRRVTPTTRTGLTSD